MVHLQTAATQAAADDYERQIKGLLGQIDELSRANTLVESKLSSLESRRDQEARTFAASHEDSGNKLERKETRVQALIGQIEGAQPHCPGNHHRGAATLVPSVALPTSLQSRVLI